MPTNDDFDSIHTPAFLLADRVQQQETENAPARAAPWWRVFKTAGLIAIATAIGAAVLSVEDPVALLANATAPLLGHSGPPPEAGEPAPSTQLAAEPPASIQSGANTQTLAQTVEEAPTQDKIVPPESKEPPAEKIEPASEDLLAKFQVWAAEKDAQAQAASVQSRDAPAPVVNQIARTARVPHRPMQRHAMPIRNARAEVRQQAPKKREKRAQIARPEPPRTNDARAQEVSTQNGQAPSFLPTFGPRN